MFSTTIWQDSGNSVDANPALTVTSIDGVGDYDHVYRSVMLAKLLEIHELQGLLPFARFADAETTTYVWEDDEGVRHHIRQGEGGEQGDPLMPLLFSLGVHNALVAGKSRMAPGEDLLAFLDDTYILSLPQSGRLLHDVMDTMLETGAGIQLHAGKTRIWNRGGIQPQDIDDLGEEVWSPEGVQVLGSPIGSEAFIQAFTDRRLEEERRLWNVIPSVPDLQCPWQLLLQCAGPRCHHVLRTVPPSQSARFAAGHDEGMFQTMTALLGALPGTEEQISTARDITTLPMRLGGLGLRSAGRIAPGAYWASWADALPVLRDRLPAATEEILAHLIGEPEGCLRELQTASGILDREGFVGRPSWQELRAGARPPPPLTADPGEWEHGWQCYASSASEHHFRETVVLARSCPGDQAHLRSHSGPGSGAVLHGSPTDPEFQVQPLQFRTLVLERLRLPLILMEARCECGGQNDIFGRHRAACPQSGRLKKRAVPTERESWPECAERQARQSPAMSNCGT